MINKKLFYSIILLAVIIFFLGFSSAYMSSSSSYFPYSSFGLQTTSQIVCQPGQDFVIQLTPFGCTPAVVRSDLLEENDVPVLCQLGATKINPLVDISSIDSISFSGQYSKEVSGVGFYPAKAALGIQGNLNSPVLNNIGYVVIMLKKQKNESAMPNYVTGNLTAKVSYNLDKSFGIGNALFYLPEFASESEWETSKYQFSFWNGKGYLRADDINANGATISLYAGSGKISDVNLQVGQTSNSLYLPGFECKAGLKLKLESLDNSDTRAKLRINADVVEVIKGQKFLDNKCSVQDLQNNGIVQKVTIKCQEDSGASTFLLAINPRITLNIGGTDKEVGLGDWLYDGGDKSVYLGYIGMVGNSLENKNLFVYLFAKPQKKDNLTSDELSEVNLLVNDLTNAGIKPAGIIDQVSDAMKPFVGLANRLGRYVISGQQLFDGISFGDKTQSFLGKPVHITSFSSPQDVELDSTVKEQYNNAKQDYETIETQYASEPYSSGGTVYGEEALYNEIALAFDANQKTTAFDLCTEFTKNYPHSEKDLTTYCNYQLSNSQIAGIYVTINKQVREISFDGIYEPTFNEYGVVVRADTPRGIEYLNLEKNHLAYLSYSGNDFIKLISINNDNSANIQIGVATTDGTANKIVQLTENSPNDFAKGYTFTLTKINSKKIAKVSVISNINDAGTTADFSFKIGIEKRAVILSPDQIRQQITDLNKGIGTWQNVSDVLGNVSQGLKTACLAAGVALVAKNFLLNAGGAGIARQKVMGGIAGWTQRCADSEDQGIQYVSPEDCYNENADKIDADVTTVSKVIEAQNAEKKLLEAGATTQGILGEQVVNTDKYMQENIKKVNPSLTLPASFPDPSGKGGPAIDTKNLLDNVLTTQGYTGGMYTLDQLNEIELWTKVRKDSSGANPELVAIANARLYSTLSTIQTNSEEYIRLEKAKENAESKGFSGMTFKPYTDQTKKQEIYDGVVFSKGLGNIAKGEFVQGISYNGKEYYVTLEDLRDKIYRIKEVYTLDGVKVDEDNSIKKAYSHFQKFDATSYKNIYKNAKLTYYETEPYKGMPAIVPFDLTNGWYAATKPVVSNTATNTYQLNGRVSSFYVCNVGEGGMEENIGGNDICEMINTGTGQAYNQFPGLSASEATTIINKANQAIEAASKAYTSGISGKVNILGNLIEVGIPAVNIPQFQCQDLMSPKDCLLLFNLCDPVICPSSRCDLGGTYPVKDVIQSGVIGSIALCFPNVREGIILPVCFTGIQAGIDGFLSVQKSYRDCLSESLATGKMIGICDEVYSIYLCDFFWKQALPIANLAIPRIIGALLGQNVRGGGEYLGVANAWSTTQKSFSYFINSYGINSRNAFTSRSTDVIQNEVCKLYVSAVVPSGADLLSTLTQPDSPPQFTGHFEEITFSTATIPPTSQYKVYYHIYAGKDSGSYYQVYLKGDASSSYYQDNSQTVMVDSGYVAVGSQVDETKDILATSGYKKLCINVNGQEECGFSSVSTSFGVNYLTDLYVGYQANQTNINSDSECISDYTSGIIRICATADPGQGTDPNSGTANARWKQVGNCDTQNMKCWIDTQSVQNTIKSTTIENATVSSLSSNYLNLLANQPGYLTKDEFSSVLKEIQSEKNSANRITLIDNVIEKVLLSNDKSQLLFLRGNAYADIFRTLFAKIPKPVAPPALGIDQPWSGEQVPTTPAGETPAEITETPTIPEKVLSKSEILEISDAGKRMIAAANTLNGTIVLGEDSKINTVGKWNTNCWTAVIYAYVFADVSQKPCGYADTVEKEYTFKNEHTGGETVSVTIGKTTRTEEDGTVITVAKGITSGHCELDSKTSTDNKLDAIQPGYLLSILWNKQYGHNVIFLGWTNKEKRIAQLFDWNEAIIPVGEKDKNGKACTTNDLMRDDKGNLIKDKNGNYYCKRYHIYQADLSDSANPVFMYWPPYIPSASTPSSVPEVPKQSFAPPSITNTVEETTPIRTTISDNIWQQAALLAGSSDVAAKFISQALVNAGISRITVTGTVSSALPSSADYLASLLEGRNDFVEINVDTNFKKGDILFLGKACQKDYSVAVFSTFGLNDNKKISFYTNLNGKVNLETISFNSQIDSNIYVYKAYRYVGDLTSQEKNNIKSVRTKWTLITALNQVNKLSGSYTSNKIFVDQLIYDNVLTEKECGDVRGTSTFVGSLGGAVLQKDMAWLKKLLLVKCGQNEQCTKTYLMK